MTTTRVYRRGVLDKEDFPVADVSDYLADEECVVWVDVCDPDRAALLAISEELSLHPLAVEDAVHERQRPKLDRYETHLFIASYVVSLDRDTGRLNTTEVAAFVTKNALVTVHNGTGFTMEPVLKRWDSSPELAKFGVGFFLYSLLDFVVDSHFDSVAVLDEEIEALEDMLFDDTPRDREVQRRSFELRKSLVHFRRVVLPMREVVNSLMRRDLQMLDERMTPYLQDVYDHVLRASEWTESLRDLVTTILETNLTIQGNRLNIIMKKVTSWAAIIAVPTAVTGFFGQNVPFLGFGQPLGLWLSVVISFGSSAALYRAFKVRDWL